MNQFIFNTLLDQTIAPFLRKLLLLVRNLIISNNPNAQVIYKYKHFDLNFPLSHDFPLNKGLFPEYSENLGLIAKVIKGKYQHATMIDVGANIGDSAAIVQSYVNMPVLCIEGNPKFLPLLLLNSNQLNDITIENSFVGEKDETVVTINTGGTARLETSNNGIEVKTMQSILGKHTQFKNAKLLKVDTDGFDNKIIRSSSTLLKESKPIVFFEYDPYFLKLQKEIPTDIFSFLQNHGYTKLIIFDNLGKLLCTTNCNEYELLEDLTRYYDNFGKTYLDICCLHADDEDILVNLKQEFLHKN